MKEFSIRSMIVMFRRSSMSMRGRKRLILRIRCWWTIKRECWIGRFNTSNVRFVTRTIHYKDISYSLLWGVNLDSYEYFIDIVCSHIFKVRSIHHYEPSSLQYLLSHLFVGLFISLVNQLINIFRTKLCLIYLGI